jgi:metallo-beta-lactamase family protein
MVSGNSYLLEANDKKILIDCGLFQGRKELELKNCEPFNFEPKNLDFVIVTHSHLDHIGRLPMLIKDGFCGNIFATPPTIDFARLMLNDTLKVALDKSRRAGNMPFFSAKDIDQIMNYFEPVDYHQKIKLTDGISFEFYEAGHVLGSALIELKIKEKGEEKKIIFSGDLGNMPVPFLRPAENIPEADYVLIESTYGDRLHEKTDKAKEAVEDVIEETIAKGGVLLIPSFALERAQRLLYHLNELAEQKRIPEIPVFFDAPLAIEVTKVYRKYASYFNQKARDLINAGDDLFKFPGLKFTPTIKESKEINMVAPPKIIIAGSGMSQGGRIMHHEARYLSDPKNTLLMVTYQAEGTLGKKILEGAEEVEILDQMIPVRAMVKCVSGYSSHADQQGLVDWLSAIRKPIKKIFVVQGEEKPALALAQIIKDKMGIAAEAPELGQMAELE